MVNKCCVPLCRSTSYTANVSLHRFASDPKVRKAWIHKIRRDTRKSKKNPRPFSVSNSTKICSQHFLRSDFTWGSQRKKLKSQAVPTIFAWTLPEKTKSRGSNKLELGDSETIQSNIQEVVITTEDTSLALPELRTEPFPSDLNDPLESASDSALPEVADIKLEIDVAPEEPFPNDSVYLVESPLGSVSETTVTASETNTSSPGTSPCCSDTSIESLSESRSVGSEVCLDHRKMCSEFLHEISDIKEKVKLLKAEKDKCIVN